MRVPSRTRSLEIQDDRGKTRVLIVSANTERFPEPAFPIGAAYVATAVEQAGGLPLIFDVRFHRRPARALRQTIGEFRPDLVGLSLRNADNGGFPFTRSYIPDYQQIVKIIRESTNAPIIAGGPAFSIFPRELSEALGIQTGVVGDGEPGIEGVLLRDLRGLIQAPFPHLDTVGFPDRIEEIFPAFRSYRSIGIQTSRGCPHRCIYCSYPSLEGRSCRPRDPSRVAGEIEMLNRKHGFRDFFIVDSSFNADESHMVRVLEEIIDRNLSIRLTGYLEPKLGNPEIIGLMTRAGFAGVDFGTDSGSVQVLQRMKKNFTPDDVSRASAACREAGLDFAHSLVFGGPAETDETIAETVRLMDECRPTAVLPMVGIRIYPGTEIEQIAIAENVVRQGETLLTPRFYFARRDPAWLVASVKHHARRRWNWFFPGKRDWGRNMAFNLIQSIFQDWPSWRGLSLTQRIPKRFSA